MNGYVTPVLEDSEMDPIQVGSGLGVYARDDEEWYVHLRTEQGEVDLGYADIGVSRLRPDGAPVQFFEEDDEVFVRNVDNANDVEINYLRSTDVLEKGDSAKLRGDCVVEPGLHTEFLVTLEAAERTDDDVPLPVLVKSGCRTLEISARSSDHETIMHGQSLLDVLKRYPMDNAQYESVVDELERLLESLRSLESVRDELGEGRVNDIERLTNRIINVYAFES
ncbi:hypothetical protein GRX01_05105 [Halobaculum sp. WSA2]|uniref:Uncharacterized protein n=1 Tax=Halobaculum saliterrae TaxID=2073113 RepID=A0A6B0SXN7_9EURY|nr:hypothetical protein [Halobaculum saliterrae]MXR40720.1 hypothetical protein [Halobaculum saliterrae]